MTGLSVGERLQNLRARVITACLQGGRSPDGVHLLAVSKLQESARIRTVAQLGQVDFAENYLQEAEVKMAELAELPLRWHFIGRVQSNKVKNLAGRFFAVHSVDRVVIAQKLNQHCAALNVVQNIFLQFNVAQEASKGGTDRDDLNALLHYVKPCLHLRALGLMIMPPPHEDEERARRHFRLARATLGELRATLTAEELLRHPLNELSMGTSQDFAWAVAEGATWIRIGTQIFGARKTEEKQ
jgi:pyridoxal phosphate enzyme (YggS family)